MSGRRVARAAITGGLAALLPLVWYFIAPTQLGGHTAYVTTAGTSMEPLLHSGDLAIVRATPSYEVGDVIAYRNPQLGSIVLHRIVDLEGDRFVLKGDQNSWLDAYHPARDHVLGEMVLRVPGLGGRVHAAASPAGAVAMTSLASAVVLGARRRVRRGRAGSHAARREERAAEREARRDRTAKALPSHASQSGAIAAVLGAVGAVAIGVGAILYVLPPTVSVPRNVPYEHRGAFSYTGVVPDVGHPVYGGQAVETGDPVYLKLTNRIEVTFDYDLETDAVLASTGTVHMVARVSDVNGWARTFEIAPPATFEGGAVHVTGTVDLQRLRAITAQLERVTGVQRDHYTVAVRPEVVISGSLAGRKLSETFDPELRFFLDAFQLQLEPAGMAPLGEEAMDPLEPASGSLLSIPSTRPRTFGLFGFEMGLEPLRAACLAMVLVALAGLFVVALGRFRSARRGEAALIASRHGEWLVPVGSASSPLGRTVPVDSFESLIRLAQHYGHVVLHEQTDREHAYSVEENGVTYRYLVTNGKQP